MDPLSKYKTATVATSSVVRQLMFVLDEIIKLLHKAKKAIEENDFETKYKTLSKVSETFYNLRTGINVEKGGDLVGLLDNFYKAVVIKVEKVNIEGDDPAEIDEILKSVYIVRDSIKDSVEQDPGSNRHN
jgi:flagellar biosynthetic protein FliS